MKKITILIIEDHTLVREGYTLLINADPRLEAVGNTGSVEEAMAMISQLRPDVILMDINLPGMNGIEAIHLVRQVSPSTKILGVSMHTQLSLVRKMLREGADGYLTKGSGGEEVRNAIVEVYDNRKYICGQIRGSIEKSLITRDEQEEGFKSLSQREIEIISYVKNGFSSRQISQKIGISFKTVEAHRYNILRKMKLKNTPALVNYINHAGLEFVSSRAS